MGRHSKRHSRLDHLASNERVGGNAPKDLAGRNHTIFMYASIIYLSIYVYVCMYIYIYTCDSNPPATNTCVTRTTCALPS
jgi:hypothetical protein